MNIHNAFHIGHFDEALKINPGNNEARAGREAALRLMGKSAPPTVSDEGT